MANKIQGPVFWSCMSVLDLDTPGPEPPKPTPSLSLSLSTLPGDVLTSSRSGPDVCTWSFAYTAHDHFLITLSHTLSLSLSLCLCVHVLCLAILSTSVPLASSFHVRSPPALLDLTVISFLLSPHPVQPSVFCETHALRKWDKPCKTP